MIYFDYGITLPACTENSNAACSAFAGISGAWQFRHIILTACRQNIY
jgi:hypothetical protein